MTDDFKCVAACAVLLFSFGYAPIGAAQDDAASSPDGPQSPSGDASFFAPGLVIKPVEERKNVTPIPPPPPGSPPPSPDPRNLEGVWLAEGDVTTDMGEPPKLTPAAVAEQRRMQAFAAKGTPLGGLSAKCRPTAGAFNLGYDLFPAEIIQTPEKIVILNEEGRSRWQIYLNRALPKNPPSQYFGYSVGRWEGDTLVVQTLGVVEQWGMMSPIGKSTRLTHHIRKLDGGARLELKTTTEDPEFYAAPYRSTKHSAWHPELHLLEFQCEENREGALEGVVFEE